MSYSCLEELQVDLDLHMLDKTLVLSKAGCKYNDGWLIVTGDGICHLFDKDGNPDDIKKVTYLNKKYIKKDITKIVIPDSVTRIDDETFTHCNRLMNVTIGNGVTWIGEYAFFDCSSLTNMTIPDSVMNIWCRAFEDCSGLTSVTVLGSETSIGYDAFYGCDKLTNLTFKGKTLEQVKKMRGYPWEIKDKSIIQVG